MDNQRSRILSLVLVILSLLTGFSNFSAHAAGPNQPFVAVWSNKCSSSNITINPGCGLLTVSSTISVQVNVTNAPVGSVNGFEFYLYYNPSYLNATGIDEATGTVFANPSVLKSEFLPLGTVHLAEVCLHCANDVPNGPLVNINFKILAVGVSPLTLAAGLVPPSNARSFTVLTTPSALAPVTADGYFKNEPTKLGPVASFTFSPSPAKTNQQVTFDASGSYDPDNLGALNKGISLFKWDFGGASSQSGTSGASTLTFKLGGFFGNFSVRLVVVDSDDTFWGMQTQVFTVTRNPFHDLVAQSMTVSPTEANPGEKVSIKVIVGNNGTFPENFNLAVSYNPTTVIGTNNSQAISIGTSSTFDFKLDTSGLAPGFYTLTANVTVLPSGNNTSGVDNIRTNNIVTSTLRILEPSSSSTPILVLAAAAVAGVVALTVVGLLLKRRRKPSASR